jgi:hypothetical protein
MVKNTTGNYPCPDVFDIADGALWNNKLDNILVYHRPFAQTEPSNPLCEFHSKKIRRQKIVGKKGFSVFEMLFKTRRFFFNGLDPLQKILNEKNITFKTESTIELQQGWVPFNNENEDLFDTNADPIVYNSTFNNIREQFNKISDNLLNPKAVDFADN